MPTKTLTIDDAMQAVADAEKARDALAEKARALGAVKPIELAEAEAAVTLARTRLEGAHAVEAAAAEADRQTQVDELRSAWIEAHDQKVTIAADVDAAVAALASALAGAKKRHARLDTVTRELARLGPLPDGETAEAGEDGRSGRPHATIAGRTWDAGVDGDNSALLAAEVAWDAIHSALGDAPNSIPKNRLFTALRAMALVRVSESYR